jgi:voltage-gated potassium channel
VIRLLISLFQKKKGKKNFIFLKVFMFFLVLLWFSTSGFLYFELPKKPDLTWLDSLWWAIVTMTTVGYGDYFPESTGGRFIVGIPTMIIGIGILGFILSEIATSIMESNIRRLRGMADLKLSNHIIIINYTQIDQIKKIYNEFKNDEITANKEICLIDDELESLPEELHQLNIHFVSGNATRNSVLLRACADQASHCIVLCKDIKDNNSDYKTLAIILMLEKLNKEIISIAECVDYEKIEQIETAGCDSVICMSELTTNIMVQELQDLGIKHVITEMTSNSYGQQLYITEINSMKKWTISELLNWSNENRYLLMGIKRDKKTLLNCEPDFIIKNGDQAILLGKNRIKTISL